ncbi:MAG: hypothetical protein JWO23_2143 [Solirubrobacterales bacterium]|nr:hypothetical protein [Solirubrobacterales bacterium]
MPKTTSSGQAKQSELPDTLKRSPPKAQRTFAKAHDSAVREYGEGERAHRVAFAALKHSFEKRGDHWEPKDRPGPSDPRARNPRAGRLWQELRRGRRGRQLQGRALPSRPRPRGAGAFADVQGRARRGDRAQAVKPSFDGAAAGPRYPSSRGTRRSRSGSPPRSTSTSTGTSIRSATISRCMSSTP